jgi:hypothetical protein
MPYCRSSYRNDFDKQITFLVRKARHAQRLKPSDAELRDLVFQSCVFLTGAAIETYIRLIIEAWVFNIKMKNRGAITPVSARAYIASKRLGPAFSKYFYDKDEKNLIAAIQDESSLWPLLVGGSNLPSFFEGKAIHDGAAYPSIKNIKKLFARLGIKNMIDEIGKALKRDAELMIDGFQNIRTALAHSAPPTVTINDVETRLSDSQELVGAIDRIFCRHVTKHGGRDCWPIGETSAVSRRAAAPATPPHSSHG